MQAEVALALAWGSRAARAGTKPLSCSDRQSTCSKATRAPRAGPPDGPSRGRRSSVGSPASPYVWQQRNEDANC